MDCGLAVPQLRRHCRNMYPRAQNEAYGSCQIFVASLAIDFSLYSPSNTSDKPQYRRERFPNLARVFYTAVVRVAGLPQIVLSQKLISCRMMDVREDAQAAIDTLQRRRLQNRIAQKNRRKRQAELEQTRLREAENQTRESQQHKARSEVSPHDLHFRSPKNDTHKPGPESFTSDQSLRNIPSIEPMEPFGTTTFGNDVVSASDELTWDPEDYLKTTMVCDIDVTNAYSNLGEKTQGHLGLDSASLSIGCTAMTTTTRYSPSSPTKARSESNTGKENGPHSQAFAAFHNACVDRKCDHQLHVAGYKHRDSFLEQKLPECHRNKTPTLPFAPVSEKLQHQTSGDLEMFSGSYGVSNRGKTALHISAERANGGIVRLLILHGVDVNGVDSWGRTALHYACGSASVDVVTQLLKGGADPDVRDHEGRSPLHAAVEAGCDAVVCLLAQEGADLNAVIGFGSGGSVQDSFEIIEA